MKRIRINVLLFITTTTLLLWGARVAVYGQQAPANSGTTSIESTIGVVTLNPASKEESPLKFFNEDGSLWYEYSFYGNAGASSRARADFKPFAFHPDYFLLVVKCVKKHADRWEVRVNEETGLKKFVRAGDRNFKFQTWSDHVLRLFAVGFDRSVNPVRTSPSAHGNPIQIAEKIIFRPVQIRGNWLKVRVEPSGTSRLRSRAKTGWIKWRDAKNLLIEPFYFA